MLINDNQYNSLLVFPIGTSWDGDTHNEKNTIILYMYIYIYIFIFGRGGGVAPTAERPASGRGVCVWGLGRRRYQGPPNSNTEYYSQLYVHRIRTFTDVMPY